MHLSWRIAQKAERKWWQLYLRDKDIATYQNWKINYWTGLLETIADIVPITANASILDAGCGPAGIFIAFPQNKVTAFDTLIEMYENDLPHFSKNNHPNVDFQVSPIEDFSSDKQYDVIFCMNAINHVFDIKKGYKNLALLLKPGGKLIISIDTHNYSFFKYLFRLLPGDILHPCQYDLNEYAGFLQQQGLTILKTEKLKSAFFFDYYVQVAQKL